MTTDSNTQKKPWDDYSKERLYFFWKLERAEKFCHRMHRTEDLEKKKELARAGWLLVAEVESLDEKRQTPEAVKRYDELYELFEPLCGRDKPPDIRGERPC